MFPQHSFEGYTKIPTITQQSIQNNQKDFENSENLKYQIIAPISDFYFDPNIYHVDFRYFRIDSYNRREESKQMISQYSFSDFFRLKYFPNIYYCVYGKGLLYGQYWFHRKTVYIANDEEFFAYLLHPEDVNFDTQFYKENRIKLTIIFNNIQYITINAFDFMAIGDTLNMLLKYPLLSNFYSFTVQDNLYQFDLDDFALKIKYFVKHNILHDGSIILIQKPAKRFIFC